MKGEIGNISALVPNRCRNPAAGKISGEGEPRVLLASLEGTHPWMLAGVPGRTSFIKRASMQKAERRPGGKNAILTSLPTHLRVPLITT